MRYVGWIILIACVLENVGCRKVETSEEALKRLVPNAAATTKISGKVTIDGAPVAHDVWVTLHPTDSANKLRPRGQTDERGNFTIGTFMKDDGAAKGDYKITIEWLTFSKRAKDWEGPDKLKNQFSNPATTPHEISVTDDKPIVLPTFELEAAGVTGNKAPKKPIEPK